MMELALKDVGKMTKRKDQVLINITWTHPLGSILLPNGDKIDGEWKGDQIIKATYTKGNTFKLPK